MSTDDVFCRGIRVFFSALCGALLTACQVMDLTVEPRTYQVNLGTQNVREELILLNIVRASRFEPLNFTALSKYTASGSLGATGSVSNNIGVDFGIFRGGPIAGALAGATPKTTLGAGGSATTGNSFDLVPLDTQDFYANFLAPLTPEKINLLVNAGLSREVVFHSLIKSINVNLTAHGIARVGGYRQLRYNNDPTDDRWGNENNSRTFEICKEQADIDSKKEVRLEDGRKRWAPFYTTFWTGEHRSHCSYHKFLLLLGEAFKYGVTTAIVAKDPASKFLKVNQINVTVSSTPPSEKTDQKVVIVCFDAAIAASYDIPLKTSAQCGPKEKKGPLQTSLGIYDASVEPVLQSAYGVFQYYGELLRTETSVDISKRAQRKTGDPVLFKITADALGCFAQVAYGGRTYCVPAEHAFNTKEVMTLLIALVNLSTSRSSLPVTPTVLVNP